MQTQRRRRSGVRVLAAALVLGAALAAAPGAGAQPSFDFCGCAGSPSSLGSFHSDEPGTWPAGTRLTGSTCAPVLEIPLPEDGVLVFDSFTVNNTNDSGCNPTANATVVFVPNAANTPVTLLVKGNLAVQGGDVVSVAGGTASAGTTGAAGVGGPGGPGGFAGGDAAYQISNLAADGGAGIGPGGGVGSIGATRASAFGGTFVGTPELRPLLGGSGGGGGHSATAAAGCAGGGGGGGGGALLIAANGTVSVNGTIRANGGDGGARATPACSSGGGSGSGGALRIVANRIEGSGAISAIAGTPGCCTENSVEGGRRGSVGRIRLEAITNTFDVSGANPPAVRAPAPAPLVNPITPAVRIARIGGAATPANPIGHRGQIDMIVAAPGVVQIDLATTDVPAGTDVEVTVKPKVGGAPYAERVTLAPASCSAGACDAALAVDLAAGAYIVEARATFETP